MGLLGACVSSVWLIRDVKLAKQIQLGLQLLPGVSGDVLDDFKYVWKHRCHIYSSPKGEHISLR